MLSDYVTRMQADHFFLFLQPLGFFALYTIPGFIYHMPCIIVTCVMLWCFLCTFIHVGFIGYLLSEEPSFIAVEDLALDSILSL